MTDLKRPQEIIKKLQDEKTGIVTLISNREFVKLQNLEDSGDIPIEGWFVTESFIESHRLVVRADAFDYPESMSLFNGRVLAFHDDYDGPVGRVTDLEIVKGEGLRGKATLWNENPDLFKRNIREGVLNAFSIGFTIDTYSYDKKEDILTVTKARLKEVSVVNIGADSHAQFRVTKSENEEKENSLNLKERNVTLAETKDKQLDTYMSKQEELGAKVKELQEMLTGIKEVQQLATENSITKSELAERMEKFNTELNGIKESINKVKLENESKERKLAYTDYRSLIRDFVWLTDDNGNKLGEIDQRAYCLFQMPVDYEKMENGYELRNLRDLYDATLIADAMSRFKQRARHNIRALSLFKQLVKATEKFDKDVALAMAGGNTGFGEEWLPEEMSSEFEEILRIEPRLATKFMTWNMPRGGSAKYPFQNGKAVVYKGGEALVDNAEEHRKTNIATGVKTFTPELFVGALVASEELTEDAVLDMVSFVRQELAKALLEGLESAIINGDDSATHFDNAGGDSVYETYNVETIFKGLRKLGISNARDIEDSSSSTGVNALELVNFTDAKQDLGVAGVNPSECLYVTGVKGRTAVQQALFKEDALGVLTFMLSGTLPNIDGSEIYISGQYDEQLDSNGLRNSGNDVKHTSMVCVHKPSFRIGQRRGVTLEFNKNILTQQRQFVATARWDFGKISADVIEPVSEMINIQHTT